MMPLLETNFIKPDQCELKYSSSESIVKVNCLLDIQYCEKLFYISSLIIFITPSQVLINGFQKKIISWKTLKILIEESYRNK